ncbi:MAG: DUF2851 family protein [Bacteroidales bacterium]|nr:DUF2851 family protein [Bacteroidales bacterium]
MKEAFLHYVWQYQLFDTEELYTTAGERLTIISPGRLNRDAGPDFKGAVVRIGNLTWAGDVEIHIRSSDWYRHKHQQDEKYMMVALHVVYEHDREVERMPGELFPTLSLEGRIFNGLYDQYLLLTGGLELQPCSSFLDNISPMVIRGQLDTMLLERMLRKQNAIRETVTHCHGDWQEALYRHLAIGFGLKTNADAFELTAKSLPYKVVKRHAESALQVQSLVFGQAGMLGVAEGDDYYLRLKSEYDYLRYKYQLTPIEMHHWNLLRLRPQNFPCVRLSQFAEVLHSIPDLWGELTRNSSMDYWWKRFSVSADDYWSFHYHFNKKTEPHATAVGEMTISLLFINVMVPILFAYHKFRGEDELLEETLNMLEAIPFEQNRITRGLADFPHQHAADSQALLELYNNYCKPRRCLECAIGDCIVKSSIVKSNNHENGK